MEDNWKEALPDREERRREALRLGAQAEASKDFLQHLLALRRETLVHEVETDENDADAMLVVSGRFKELNHLLKLVDSMIYSKKLLLEESEDE